MAAMVPLKSRRCQRCSRSEITSKKSCDITLPRALTGRPVEPLVESS